MALDEDLSAASSEEDIRQRILRDREAIEAERMARDKELEAESEQLDKEIEQEIRGTSQVYARAPSCNRVCQK